VKSKSLGRPSFVGGLSILLSILAGCSDVSMSASSAPGVTAVGPRVFEKGKSYVVSMTNDWGGGPVTVLDIGPYPWLKLKMWTCPNEERWVNSNHIIMVETLGAAPKVKPAIKSAQGDIDVATNSIDVPADGLKEFAAVFGEYAVKRENSWFLCAMPGEEKRVVEYRGLRVEFRPGSLSAADKLNGYEWRGYCAVLCDASREFADGKWGQWEGLMYDAPSPVFMSDVEKKNGKWQMVIRKDFRFLPVKEWSIPQEAK
jgi:hypothetical protein